MGRASFNIGMGKPEPLPHKNKGYCTRRYDHEHRLIYKIEGKHIQFVKYRFQ
ncbi:MAG TPA: type II toxin-antitoxin system YoeB family toxin [Chitinophagaceae bacterium]|nr:type II toxin-antitoxin system YoeB family toxin [Chitinophagaceae bacterium]